MTAEESEDTTDHRGHDRAWGGDVEGDGDNNSGHQASARGIMIVNLVSV